MKHPGHPRLQRPPIEKNINTSKLKFNSCIDLSILQWFFDATSFNLMDDATETVYKETLDKIDPLNALLDTYMKTTATEDRYFVKEFILWALVEFKQLDKKRIGAGFSFKDQYGAYFSAL